MKSYIKKSNYTDFLKKKNEFLSEGTNVTEDDYINFLNAIIPKTKDIFNIVKKNLLGKLSFYNVINYLEPFLIYTDDITYKQYEVINNYVFNQIRIYKKNFVKNKQKFEKDIAQNFKPIPFTNVIFNILDKPLEPTIQVNLKEDVFIQGYDLITTKDKKNSLLSSSEILSKIYNFDYANLFMCALSILELPLYSTVDIHQEFEIFNEELKKEATIESNTSDDEICKQNI